MNRKQRREAMRAKAERPPIERSGLNTPEWLYKHERFGPLEIGQALRLIGMDQFAYYYEQGLGWRNL